MNDVLPSPDFVDEAPGAEFAETGDDASLFEDLKTLASDGKTYLEAELAFQKSRASFAAGRAKSSLAYGAVALAFVHLALIALVIGLLLALATIVGPWFATLIVVGVMLVLAAIFALKLRGQMTEMSSMFGGDPQ